MFCGNCGNSLVARETFCRNCGTPAQGAQQKRSSDYRINWSEKDTLLPFIVGVIGLLMVGASVYFSH